MGLMEKVYILKSRLGVLDGTDGEGLHYEVWTGWGRWSDVKGLHPEVWTGWGDGTDGEGLHYEVWSGWGRWY
ncbi:hypothetical protein RRG08_000807 [Elysia crispata]|uniref:Uncharacterized protein n=1 Tax=Elysia crispata TaxID=231223 RepID=A0AAE0XY12_9GAST|nr:hypothetical protein RRG08_000807 [Elysia crispata]